MREYKDSDYETICRWCSLRDKPSPPQWAIPESGYVVDDVACGFFILMSNNCAMFDFYISNPHADRAAREEALNKITSELIETAKAVGVRMIIANTQSESIKRIAMKFDFIVDGDYTTLSREV